MIELSEHDRTYWQYEYDVSSRYMIPWLEQQGLSVQGTRVLDVGCCEGGGLCSMYDRGAHCAGFDIDQRFVDIARALHGGRRIEYATGNLYEPVVPFSNELFDLVTLHDVFEHLEQKDEMLRKLERYLKPEGRMLITFPPYFSAYGAHQQHLHTTFARLPFFHLIPFSISFLLPRLSREAPSVVQEVQKLARLKMGMRAFEEIATRNGLTVLAKKAYLISPNHIRFGLKPIPAGVVAELPLVGEVLCSGVLYLLSTTRTGNRREP